MKTIVSAFCALIIGVATLGSAHARPQQQGPVELNVALVTPDNATVDTAAPTITVLAAGLPLAPVTIVFDGVPLNTSPGATPSEFKAQVPAAVMGAPAGYLVALKYAAGLPGTGLPFIVNNILPNITSITTTPSPLRAGQAGVIEINGTDFASQSTVTIGGIGRIITARTATKLTTNVPSGVHITPGAVSVVVVNPATFPAITLNDSGSFNVIPGLPASFTLSPAAPTSVAAGGTVNFTVSGVLDQYGNAALPAEVAVNWTVATAQGFVLQSSTATAATVKVPTLVGSYVAAVTVNSTVGTAVVSRNITVVAGAPASVAISPISQIFAAGATLPFSAVAYDAFNNVIPGANFNWTAQAGTITAQGVSASHTAATVVSTYTVEAAVVGFPAIKNTAQVIVRAGPAVRAELTPANATLDRGQQATFNLTGYDAFDNPTVVRNSTWNSAGGGTVVKLSDSQAVFTAGTVAGTFPNAIRAISGTIVVGAPITVKPGPVDRVLVTPSGVTIAPNATQTFNAQAVDSDNNPIPGRTFNWSLVGMPPGAQLNNVTATSAQLAGLTAAGTYLNSVKAADSAQPAKFGTANVVVTTAGINSVIVTPADVTLLPGERRTFSAEARDQFGNVIPNVVAGWQTGGAGVIESSGPTTITLRASTTAGVYTNQVVATIASKTGTASVTVGAGNTSRISVTPSSGLMAINSTATFVATALDNQNNPKPGVAFTWSASSPFTIVGDANSASVTLQSNQSAGVFPNALTVSGDGKTSSITVTVQPAQLTALRITPANGSVQADQNLQLTVEGLDQFGNVIAAPAVTWSALPNAGTIDQTGKLKAGRTARTVTNAVSVSANGITSSATVTVLPGPLQRIGITPSPAVIAANTQRLFTATGFDAFNNAFTLTEAVWTTTGGGTLAASSSITAAFRAGGVPGTYNGALRISSDGKDAAVDVLVTDLVISISTSSSLLRTNGRDVVTVTAIGRDSVTGSPIDAGNVLTVAISACSAGSCELLRLPTDATGQQIVIGETGANGAATLYLRSRNNLGANGVLTSTRNSITTQVSAGPLRASTVVQGRFDPLRLSLGAAGRDTPNASNNHVVCSASQLTVPRRIVQRLDDKFNIYKFKAPSRTLKVSITGYTSVGQVILYRVINDRCPGSVEVTAIPGRVISGGSFETIFADLAPQNDYFLAVFTSGGLSSIAYVLDIQAQ